MSTDSSAEAARAGTGVHAGVTNLRRNPTLRQNLSLFSDSDDDSLDEEDIMAFIGRHFSSDEEDDPLSSSSRARQMENSGLHRGQTQRPTIKHQQHHHHHRHDHSSHHSHSHRRHGHNHVARQKSTRQQPGNPVGSSRGPRRRHVRRRRSVKRSRTRRSAGRLSRHASGNMDDLSASDGDIAALSSMRTEQRTVPTSPTSSQAQHRPDDVHPDRQTSQESLLDAEVKGEAESGDQHPTATAQDEPDGSIESNSGDSSDGSDSSSVLDEDDVSAGRATNRFRRLSAHTKGNYCVTTDEGTGLIVAGSKDGSISVWSTEPTVELKHLLSGTFGHTKPVTCVCISSLLDDDSNEKDEPTRSNTVQSGPLGVNHSKVAPAPTTRRRRTSRKPRGCPETAVDRVLARAARQFRKCPIAQAEYELSSGTFDDVPSFYQRPAQFCLSGSQDKTVKLWDLSNGTWAADICRVSTGIYSLTLHPDNRVAIAGTYDASIYVLSIAHRAVVQKLANHHSGTIWSLDMLHSHDTDSDKLMLVAGSGDRTLSVWTYHPRLAKYSFSRRVKGHRSAVLCVRTTARRAHNFILSSSRAGIVKVWSTGAMNAFDRPRTLFGAASRISGNIVDLSRFVVITCIHTIQCSHDPIWSLAITDDDCSVVTCSTDKKLLQWDIESAALQTTIVDLSQSNDSSRHRGKARAHFSLGLEWHSLKDVALLSRGEKVIFVSEDDDDVDVLVWDASHGSLRQELDSQKHGVVACVAMQLKKVPTHGPDGATSGSEPGPLGSRLQPRTAASSSQGLGAEPPLLLLSGGDDSAIRVWNRDDGLCLFRCTFHDDAIVGLDMSEPHPHLYAHQITGGDVLPLARVVSVSRSAAFVWHIFCTANPPKKEANVRRRTTNLGVTRKSTAVVASDFTVNRRRSALQERLKSHNSTAGPPIGTVGDINTTDQLYVFAGAQEHSASLNHPDVVCKVYGRPGFSESDHKQPDSVLCPIFMTTARLLSTGVSGRVATAASDGTIVLWQIDTRDPRTVVTGKSVSAEDLGALKDFQLESQVLRLLVNPACCIHPEACRLPSFRNLNEMATAGASESHDEVQVSDGESGSPSTEDSVKASPVLAEFAHPYAVLSLAEVWLAPSQAAHGTAFLYAAKHVKEQATRRKFHRGWGFCNDATLKPAADAATTPAGAPTMKAAARIADSLERSAAEERFFTVSACSGGMCILWSSQGHFVYDLSQQLVAKHRATQVLNPYYSLDQLLESVQLVAHEAAPAKVATQAPRLLSRMPSNVHLSGADRKIQERSIVASLKHHLTHILCVESDIERDASVCHSKYFEADASAAKTAVSALKAYNGGYRYDPLLYLQTRSHRQLRQMLKDIGIDPRGATALEDALALHDYAGSYFLPRAIPAIAVDDTGSNLAIGNFDATVSVVRLRLTSHRSHAETSSVWANMRARVNNDGDKKGAASKTQKISAKLLWRQTIAPTARETQLQQKLDMDYDYRVSALSFLSTKVLIVGTYHGRVKILRHDGREILRSDLALRHDNPIQSVATDGQTAVVASDNKVRLYDLSPRQPSVEVAAYLCEEGFTAELVAAYPNVVNCRDTVHKRSLVHIFAAIGNAEILGALLEPRPVAVAFLKDKHNETALDVAMGHRNSDCVELLVDDIIRRQDVLDSESRECIACSLPQLAVLYPNFFRHLLQNMRLLRIEPDSVVSDNIVNGRGRGSSMFDGNRPSITHFSSFRRQGAHAPPPRRSRQLTRALSWATGGLRRHDRAQHQHREAVQTSVNTEGNLMKTKLAVKCLPLVQGDASPRVEERSWLGLPEYENARQVAEANFQLDQCVPQTAVTPLPYMCHPLLFKTIQADHQLQDCLHSPSIVPVVQFKWNKYAAELFRQELYNYIVFLVMTTLMTLMLTQEATETVELGFIADTWHTLLVAVALGVVQMLTFRSMWMQLKTACTERSAFFRNVWTWLVLSQILLVELTVVMYLMRLPHVRMMAAILSVVTWTRLLFYLRAHKETGALVRMILEIAKDMRYFLLILVLMIFGFANAVFVLLHNSYDETGNDITPASHSTIFRSAVQMYAGIMGASEFDVYDKSPNAWLLWCLYVLFTLMVFIIMLNLLIALMGDSHERVNNQRAQARQTELAGIVVNIETEMRVQPHNVHVFFPKWVHVLQPTRKLNTASLAEWTSRTRMVTQAVANASAEIRQEIGEQLSTTADGHSRQLARSSKELMRQIRFMMGDDSDSSVDLSESDDEEYQHDTMQ